MNVFNWLINSEIDILKGEYEDYTWGYGQNPLDYSF